MRLFFGFQGALGFRGLGFIGALYAAVALLSRL